MRIAVIANTAWYLMNFRLNLMRMLKVQGHEVIAICPSDAERVDRMRAAGIVVETIPISGSGVNPIQEMNSIWKIYGILRRQKIDIVFSYTPKGNIYASVAALACGASYVPNISGVGRTMTHKSILSRVVATLYRATLGRALMVFFQNREDMESFIAKGLAPRKRCFRLPGSGVDIQRFEVLPRSESSTGKCAFLLVARMLWDKGIGEYVEAARRIRAIYPQASFRLLGFLDVDNPSAVSRKQMEAWVAEGIVEYLGATDDVRPYLEDCDCVVLPSYYGEGVPRSLLEAAASGRPVITADTPGCRDTVLDGLTGYLCRPRDPEDLARVMSSFLSLSHTERVSMGLAGRRRIENEFDERIVLDAYCALLAS